MTESVMANGKKLSFFSAAKRVQSIVNSVKIRDIPLTKQTHVQLLVICLQKNIAKLKVFATDEKLEVWAILIHECMSSYGRNFHGIEHALNISNGSDDPILIIAGLFHDTVYCSVDGGLSEKQMSILKNNVVQNSTCTTDISLGNFSHESDPLLSLVAAIFGFSPGDKLPPFSGGNEFLSAVLAVRTLSQTLKTSCLAKIVACIEATIPFRKNDENGTDPVETLLNRMRDANETFQLDMTDEDILEAVHRATELGNRDVVNFSSPDHTFFLDQTWKLLPESNVPLRQRTLYYVSDFHQAMLKMEKFFISLDPQTVFRRFRDVPDEASFGNMTAMAKKNIDFSRHYIRTKLLGVVLVAALAQLSGGDGPISLFMGDLPRPGHITIQLEEGIPAPEIKSVLNKEVFHILANGRNDQSSFDIKNSPIAAYLYGLIGSKGLDDILKHTTYPMDDDHSRKFLDMLPNKAALTLIQSCSKIALTRSRKLNALYLEYSRCDETEQPVTKKCKIQPA